MSGSDRKRSGSWSTAALGLIRLVWRRQFELQLPPLLFTHIKRLLALTCTANNIRGHFVKWLSTDLSYTKLLNTAVCNVKWRLLLPDDDEPGGKVQDKGFFFLVSDCAVCVFAKMQSEAATVSKVNLAKPKVLKPHLFP